MKINRLFLTMKALLLLQLLNADYSCNISSR
jgi:hypothetical protein